jgi:hypothetical protein
MIARTGRTIPLTLALLALGASPAIVLAQSSSGMNPYGNSGYADYREFSNPIYGNNPALPGQSRLNNEPLITRPRPNTYRQYADDDDGDFESNLARRGSSAGVPYNEAYQRLNRQRSGVYKPNDSSKNDEYVQRMKKRDEDFAKALKEKDPVKRAKLLRDLNNESIKSSAAQSRPKTTATSRAPNPNRAPNGSSALRAPAPPNLTAPTPLGDRRISAPPPVAGVGPRRSSSSNAPAPPTSGTSRPRTSGSTTSSTAPDPSTIAVPAPPR